MLNCNMQQPARIVRTCTEYSSTHRVQTEYSRLSMHAHSRSPLINEADCESGTYAVNRQSCQKISIMASKHTQTKPDTQTDSHHSVSVT